MRIDADCPPVLVVSAPNHLDHLLLSLPLALGEVAALVLEGATDIEIARRRRCSVRTVHHQVADLLQRFDVDSRAELVRVISVKAHDG